jgi:hypothetical protein
MSSHTKSRGFIFSGMSVNLDLELFLKYEKQDS